MNSETMKYRLVTQQQIQQNKSEILKALIEVTVIFAILFFAVEMIFHPVIVDGESMEPTFHDGQLLLCSTDMESLNRFDCVTAAVTDRDTVIKRIIGMPGETISMIHGRIYVDGRILTDDNERPVCQDAGVLSSPVTLGEDEYFIMGDNRNHSSDSRTFGPVKKEQITGKVTKTLKGF